MPDTSFGDGGLASFEEYQPVDAAVVAPDGTVAVVTSEFQDGDEFSPSFRTIRVWRFGVDGRRMTSFDENGVVAIEDEDAYGPFGGNAVSGAHVAVDGRVTLTSGDWVIRLTASGAPDEAYGKDGKSRFQGALIQETSATSFQPGRGFVSPDGRVFLAATFSNGSRKRAVRSPTVLVRLDRAGRPDPTFSNDGVALGRVGRPKTEATRSERGAGHALLAFEPGGAITLASTRIIDGRIGITLIRFLGGTLPRQKCGGEPATVQGTDGVDHLIAGAVTSTGDGDDVIRKPGGQLCAGAGDDVLSGRSFTHAPGTVFTGPGDDVLTESEADSVVGGPGDDRIEGGADLRGGPGDDQISGWFQLSGGAGNDVLEGSKWGDRIAGGSGRDRMFGNGEDDVLRGGPGRDRMFGGKQTDQLFGGPGRDLLDAGPAGPRYRQYRGTIGQTQLRVRIFGGQIVDGYISTRLECSNGKKDDGTLEFFTEKIKANGRFEVYEDYDDDYSSSDQIVRGRVTRRTVTGRFRSAMSEFGVAFDDYECFSGRPGKRWVRFRATRKADAVQVVRQG